MAKFNIGDRVITTQEDNLYYGAPKGSKGVIVKSKSPSTYVNLVLFDTWRGGHDGGGFHSDDPRTGAHLFVSSCCMELIEDASYKVGQTIRLTRSVGSKRRGAIGTITHVRAMTPNAPYPIRVDFPGDKAWLLEADEFEVFPEAPAVPSKFDVSRAPRATAPQAVAILKHLKTGKTISPMEAIVTYSIMRLAPAIHDLRCAGYRIESDIRKDAKGHRYARYSLAA